MPGEALAPLLHAGGVLGACGSRVSELAWRQRDKEAYLLRHLAGLLLGALGCGSRRCARLAGLLLRAFGRSGRGRARRRRRLFRAVYEPTDVLRCFSRLETKAAAPQTWSSGKAA